MSYVVNVSGQADQDLRELFEYIAYKLRAPENAAGQLDRLEEAILGLAVFPDRYALYRGEPWRSRGLRVMPVDNFCVYYIPNAQNNTVQVIRVLYNGRDERRALLNETD